LRKFVPKGKNMPIENFVSMPIESLEENSWNPNQMSEEAFDRLVKEIGISGFISACQVVPIESGKYRIIGGAHRYRAALKLGYTKIPVVVMSDAKFKSEDLQKFLTVKMNVLSGELDPEKFRLLYEEMVDKYGEDSLKDLFGFVEEDSWELMMKAVKRELKDAGVTDLSALENIQDHSLENLSKVLNGIFTEGGDTLKKNGFMIFTFEGIQMFFADVSRNLFEVFNELELDTPPLELESKLLDWFDKSLERTNGKAIVGIE
jgi:hypothetical protein